MQLEIEVLPADIPDHIDLDVTDLAIGHSIFVRDITGARRRASSTSPDSPVCSVVAPRDRRGGAGPRGGRGRGGPGGAGAHPEAQGGSRRRGRRVGPARDRGAGQSRPGVRGHPAQRRFPARGSPGRRAGGSARFAGASGPAVASGAAQGSRRPAAQAADVHEPERGRAGPAPGASGLRPRPRPAGPGGRRRPARRAGSVCAAPARPAGTTGSRASRARSSGRTTPGCGSASGPAPRKRRPRRLRARPTSPGTSARRSTPCSIRWPRRSSAG